MASKTGHQQTSFYLANLFLLAEVTLCKQIELKTMVLKKNTPAGKEGAEGGGNCLNLPPFTEQKNSTDLDFNP
jgi:hypothetical protein